jgi:hypothetical protein
MFLGCSPCCGGLFCATSVCQCLNSQSLTGVSVSYSTNMPDVCGGTPATVALADNTGVRGNFRQSNAGCTLDLGYSVPISQCNTASGLTEKSSVSLRITSPGTGVLGPSSGFTVAAFITRTSLGFNRTYTQTDQYGNQTTIQTYQHQISGVVNIGDWCSSQQGQSLVIGLTNPDPDDPAQYTGTMTLTMPPPASSYIPSFCTRTNSATAVNFFHVINSRPCDESCGEDNPLP